MAAGSIGILTTEQRKIWSAHRDTLRDNKHNAKCLEVADTVSAGEERRGLTPMGDLN